MRNIFRRDGRVVECAGFENRWGDNSLEGSNPSPFANGAVQQSGRCEVGLNRLLTRKGENTVGSIPTRSPNLIGLACGVNRGQPQGAEGVGAYSNLAKPARFLTLLLQGNRKNHPEFSPRVKIVNARRCVIRLLAIIAQWKSACLVHKKLQVRVLPVAPI